MNYTIINKKKHWIYFLKAILGVSSLVWQVTIYRQTIIPVMVPICITLCLGTIVYIIDRKNYASTYIINNIQIFAWLQSIMSWGFLLSTLFLAVNKHFASEQVAITKHSIISKTKMIGHPRSKENEQPLIRIDYFGTTKELVFSKEYLPQMNLAKFAVISTSEGFFGFKIIQHQALSEK